MFDGPIRVDANTGWTPGRRAGAAARAGAARRGAHRAAVPGPPATTSCAGSRSGRRCRSSPTRARSRSRTSTRSSAWSRASTSSSRSAAALGPARRMLERARELGLPDVPRLHGGDLDRDRRLGGRRAARGLGGPRRLPAARRRPGDAAWSSGPTSAGGCADGPGLGLTRGPPLATPCIHKLGAPAPRLSTEVGAGVDKSVGQMVEKPLPRDRRSPRTMSGRRRRPDWTQGAAPATRVHSSTAGGGRPFIARRPACTRVPEGREDLYRCCLPTPPASAHARSRGFRAVLLPAAAGRVAGAVRRDVRSSRPGGCSGGWARTRWRRSGWGSACSRRRSSRRSWRSWSPRSRRRGGRPRRR